MPEDSTNKPLVVQTTIEEHRPCEAVARRGMEDPFMMLSGNKSAGMMSMTTSTPNSDDIITETPGLSPPSSPELEICPDKGIYHNKNSNNNGDEDDDGSAIFQYKEVISEEDPLSESYKITTSTIKQEQEQDQKSINYFYRDFDAENDGNNKDFHHHDLLLLQQQPDHIKNNYNDDNEDQEQPTTPINLNGFAQKLYENRLSIVHSSRESKLILTEQDELEFAKLMEIRRKSLAAARQKQPHISSQQYAKPLSPSPLPASTTVTNELEEQDGYACEKIEWGEPIEEGLLSSHTSSPLPMKQEFSELPVTNSLIATDTDASNGQDDLGATLNESVSSSQQATSNISSSTTSTPTITTSLSLANATAIATAVRNSVPEIAPSPKPTRSRGFSFQKLRNPIENTSSWLPKKKLARLSDNSIASGSSTSSRLSSSSSAKSTKKRQQQQYDACGDSDKILVEDENQQEIIVVEEHNKDTGEQQAPKRLSSSTRSKSSSNASRSSRFKEIVDIDLSQVATDIGTNKEPPPPPPPYTDQKQQQSSVSSKQQQIANNQPIGPSRSMSLNLFGSLRNRTRSQSTPTFKGLMRNFSTNNVALQRNNNSNNVNNNNEEQVQQQQQKVPKKKRSHSVLSPAAIAVLKHNAQGVKKKGSNTTSTETPDSQDEANIVEYHHANQSKGKRLLSQLLSTARLSRRSPKKVNMGEDSHPNSKKSHAQIVRRTIIYVQPDSENFLKNIEKNNGVPPMSPVHPVPFRSTPSTAGKQQQERSTTPESDEDGGSRQKATMITRQTSVKRQISKRRNNNTSQSQPERQLEGVEVREMSDGSVVWGVVKKQGKRKSFFVAPESGYESKLEVSEMKETKEEDDDEEDEEQIEERVLSLMGLSPDLLKDYPGPSNEKIALPSPPPIPKRSPHRLRDQRQLEQEQDEQATYVSSYANRRDSSTTDVYYAPGATLPSLLQMISSEQEERIIATTASSSTVKENPTVEEQLDEVMRSLGYTEGLNL